MPPYFAPHWYACLAEAQSGLPLEDVPERVTIQDHLVQLHHRIWSTGGSHRALDLHPHWNPKNLTCNLFLSPYNRNHVSEIYLRYGKSKAQVQSFGELGLDEENSLGHHVHIAVGLAADAFFFQLAFGPWAFRDYARMRAVLSQQGMEKEHLFNALINLGPTGYEIWGPGISAPISKFGEPQVLLTALPPNTEDWLVVRRNFGPQETVLSADKIVQTCIREVCRLYSVYDLVALRTPLAVSP